MALAVFREDERTLVATSRGRRVGTLTFFRNRWHDHPKVYTADFTAFPEADDMSRVVSALFDLLRRELNDALLLRTVVREDDSLIAPLKEVGFRVQRHVYMPTLDVRTFDLSSLDSVRSRFDALGYRIATLDELRSAPNFEEKFYDLLEEVYTDTSKVMPATLDHLTLEDWRKSVLAAEEIIPEAFFVALHESSFAGFSNVFEGHRGELETGTFGTARVFHRHHRDIMLSLKQREVAYAKDRDVGRIHFEIDADDPWTLLVSAEFPLEQSLNYVSLVHVLRWA